MYGSRDHVDVNICIVDYSSDKLTVSPTLTKCEIHILFHEQLLLQVDAHYSCSLQACKSFQSQGAVTPSPTLTPFLAVLMNYKMLRI